MATQVSPKAFRKIGTGRIPYFPGTRPSVQNAQLITSTGVISLDHVLGGGLPVGSILLIEEDAFGVYSRVLLSYFMAEGVVNGHSVFVASQDRDLDTMISELPEVITSEDTVTPASGDDAMTIAWRYQNLRPVASVIGSQNVATTLGHHFDLACSMDSHTLEKADITKWSGSGTPGRTIPGFHSSDYSDLLLSLSKRFREGEFRHEDNPSQRRLARIVLHSLGSPAWSSTRGSSPAQIKKDLPYFLLCLRALCRSAYCATVVTIPTHLFQDPSIRDLCMHQCDIGISLESFAGSERETNPMFKEYQGLLQIQKLFGFNTLAQFVPESIDLAFKLRRRKFVIEKLHLPPELQESSQREQDDTPSLGCGSPKTVLDF